MICLNQINQVVIFKDLRSKVVMEITMMMMMVMMMAKLVTVMQLAHLQRFLINLLVQMVTITRICNLFRHLKMLFRKLIQT